ncbi:protein Skeletor, isoforms B/C [Phlebotomus papatasi]|uniref:protein Skeletor, isoforms B/C n=1 Tax=Phlebotomus papatasi TaxID=29031 RepID=UPI0024836D16|nr:protein Skeletor, isoforms B/C [Phlebotomus papatasi]
MMSYRDLLGLICGILFTYVQVTQAQGYYGIKIGALSQLHHGVSGDVYAVDARTIFLKNFNYDGEGPTAYFYVGNSRRPTNAGAWRLRDERGSTGVLRRYRNKDITLSLPEGKTLRDIKWFSVWCDEFAVNFGDVTIPKNLEFPRPQKIAPLSGVHGVSSDNVVIVDAQTLLVPNFSYDGEAPDAKFWVGRGAKPSPHGIRIPDENGKETPLRKYDRKTIVLTLPAELTVFDIGHFGVWCEAFTVDFGHVRIPEGIVVPPSLKMLGVSPQSKLNCEVLFDDLAFEVRWAVAGESVVVQLVAKLDNNEYMSFGVSPDPKKTVMVGADVAVAWVDKLTGKGYAFDYFLDDKSQCSGQRGSCPDARINENTNSIRLLNAAMVNGYSIVTFQRPLKASDSLDLPIFTNGSQAIVWAIGPLNQRYEVSFHSQYTKGNRLIDFGRQPIWNCPTPDGDGKSEEEASVEEEYYDRRPVNRRPEPQQIVQEHQPNRRQEIIEAPRPVPTPRPANKNGAWDIPPIQCYEPEDGVFYAQMGPTGGKQGYPAITGHVGWGISWYINGLLIPEINVVRGKTYTFVVEGGFDPEIPAKYHPFYITDDPVGGFEYKTPEEKANVRIFAGVHRSRNGVITPIGVGRLCNWTPDIDGPGADEYSSFGAYQRSLTLKCDEGEPGIITWTPDDNTPDTVYYQCFTHRYLGWKINVLDTCDEAHPSEIDEVYASPESSEGIEAESSIRHETKLRPTDNFLFQHDSDLIKNHNMNSSPPKIQFEVPGSSDITKLISDGIRAAELLEEEIARPNRTTTTQAPPPSAESMNEGEEFPMQPRPKQPEIKVPSPHFMQPSPGPGLPVFLRPPQNGQFFRPAKVPMRRNPSYTFERRPIVRPYRPFAIPQPSMLVSHYQKPVAPAFLRPFVKVKQVPIKPLATVLLLGEPTEIKPLRQVPEKKIQNTPLRIPYLDGIPMNIKKSDYPMGKPMLTSKLPPAIAAGIKEPILPEKKYPSAIKYSVAIDSKELQSTYKPATNTGFQPEKVVVEGGFKPILKRRKDEESVEEIEEKAPLRRVDILSEIDEAIEGDALFINQDEPNRAFEPMFIPSPPDSVDDVPPDAPDTSSASPATPNPTEEMNDLADMDFEEGEDKMAVAAERFDTYYLPPDNKKHRPQKYPEGAVVAFDGKAVLDTSLINSAPTNEVKQPFYNSGLSKTEQLLSTPQFGPFRGEVPLQFKSNDPRPSAPVTEYSNPLTNSAAPISTKLTLLRSDDSQINDETG